MIIFFHSSILGKQKYEEHYKKIVEICRKLGHMTFADHLLKRNYRDTDKFSREEHQKDFQRLTSQIKESDVVIVEGTSPSIGTGHYMTIALNYSKPVLVLYQNKPHGVLVGDPNRLLFLQKYSLSNSLDLEKKIKKFLNMAAKKRLNNRFNVMLDDDMNSFLCEKSKESNQSKADIIRALIRKAKE